MPITQNINAGDPITSELINSIIKDLAEIEKANNKTIIELTATGGADDVKKVIASNKVYSTTINCKSINKSKTPSGQFTWTFPKDQFKTPPKCWAIMNASGKSYKEPQTLIHVYVNSVSTEKVTFYVRVPAAHISVTDVSFDCFAVEA